MNFFLNADCRSAFDLCVYFWCSCHHCARHLSRYIYLATLITLLQLDDFGNNYATGKREFPFPAIPGNESLWFLLLNFGYGIFQFPPTPHFWDWIYFIPFSFPNFTYMGIKRELKDQEKYEYLKFFLPFTGQFGEGKVFASFSIAVEFLWKSSKLFLIPKNF